MNRSRPRLRHRNCRPILELLESRLAPAVALTYGGPGTALTLIEQSAGSTPAVTIAESGATTLRIDLGASLFDASSTVAATGLTYENAGSPATSRFATIDLSAANAVSALTTDLAGDALNLGRIANAADGLTSLSAAAASITLSGNLLATNGAQSYAAPVALANNVVLNAKAAGNVLFSSTIQSPGTQYNLSVNTGGNVTFGGALGGGGQPLAALTVSATGIAVNGGAVNTSGFYQRYSGAVLTLGAASTFMAGDVFVGQSLILGPNATTATHFLQVAGNLFLAPSETTLTTTIASPTSFGHIEVSGFTAFTGAFFAINYSGGFVPAAGQNYDIVSNGFDSIGEFANVPSPGPVKLGGVAYTVTYSGSSGGSDFILTVVNNAILAVGAGQGGGPQVKVYNPDGSLRFTLFAYDVGFTGGVAVAVGDVTGDGLPDVVTGAGASGGPHVKVFDGQTAQEIFSFMAYNVEFTGGVFVAVGDVNNDGVGDIITGAGAGGGPHVKVFSGTNLAVLASFFAYDAAFTGGVSVGAGDVNNDGFDDIITGAGPSGGPHVKVFSGTNLAVLASFLAYDPSFTGGVFVAGGDFNNDSRADIVTGAGAGGGPHVKVFSGQNLSVLADYFAYGVGFRGGVRVGADDINGDGKADVITGAGPGGGPHVKVYKDLTTTTLDSFFAFDANFTGGVFVG